MNLRLRFAFIDLLANLLKLGALGGSFTISTFMLLMSINHAQTECHER